MRARPLTGKTSGMNPKVRAVMAANHGLITRPQLMDAGLWSAQISHLVRQRLLVVVRRGVYTDAELWDALGSEAERHRLRTRAATLHMRRDFVLSHDSAAYEHGLEILQPPTPYVHVTSTASPALDEARHQAPPRAVRPRAEEADR